MIMKHELTYEILPYLLFNNGDIFMDSLTLKKYIFSYDYYEQFFSRKFMSGLYMNKFYER